MVFLSLKNVNDMVKPIRTLTKVIAQTFRKLQLNLSIFMKKDETIYNYTEFSETKICFSNFLLWLSASNMVSGRFLALY